jgi:hypothetical protein
VPVGLLASGMLIVASSPAGFQSLHPGGQQFRGGVLVLPGEFVDVNDVGAPTMTKPAAAGAS